MSLNNLQPAKGSNKTSGKRLGRGQGSGKGGTSTKGHKGAQSRSGYSRKIGFEGGQMPLQMRVPKFGFSSRVSRVSESINVSQLTEVKKIDIQSLKDLGIIKKSTRKVKIFGQGKLLAKSQMKISKFQRE